MTLDPVDELSDPAGLQVYVLAPLAVKFTDPPAQIVALLTVTTALLRTVTLVVSVFTHPFASVPVIVYCVVVFGLAVTLEPVEELSDPAGLHT